MIQFRDRANRDLKTTLDLEVFNGDRSNGEILGPQRPNDVTSYDRLARTPMFLAFLLIVLGGGAAAHVLVTSVRRRGRDLAVLKTLGFTPRQVVAVVFAQASTLIGIAGAVAVPIGAAVGGWTWGATTRWLGIVDSRPLPLVQIVLVIIGAFVVANVIAFIPGLRAARIRPAVALRSE